MAEAPEFRTTMEFAYGVARELAPGVARLVANNPGPFTFKGTNTYLVGGDAVVRDRPGAGHPAHRDAILAAGRRRMTHIVVTHTHRDHVDGVAALQAATGARTDGFRRAWAQPAQTHQRLGGRVCDQDFRPDVQVEHGDRLKGDRLGPQHAPHAGARAGSLVLCAGGQRGLLFSGDHVMGWNTTVVAPPEGRMADYLRSLELLGERRRCVFSPATAAA